MRLFVFFLFIFLSSLSAAQSFDPDKKKLIETLATRARSFTNTDSSVFYLDKAIGVAKDLKDSLAISKLLAAKGKIFETTGNYHESILAYLEGLAISKSNKNKSGEGLCNLGLSNVNFRVANNEGAWEHGLQAVKCFEPLKDTAHFIEASMLVAQIEISLGRLDEASAVYSQMLELAKKISDQALVADNLDHLGAIQSFRGDFRKALTYHDQALTINTKINNQFNLVINNANIGEAHMRLGDYAKALEFLTTAEQLGKKINANSVLIFIYYTLGECYSLKGENAVAIKNFDHSLELINSLGETRERPYVYNLLSDHYERNHNQVKSLMYFKKSAAERDSLRIISASYAMDEIKTKYEVDKKEQALRSALMENNLKEEKLTSNKQTINLLFIFISTALIGLVITVALGIKLYKSEQKLKVANKTKDALLSIIGHDLRGPMMNIDQISKLVKISEGKDKELAIKMLEKPVQSALRLLDDLLEWARSTRQESVTNPTCVYIAEAVNRSIELFQEQAAAKKIRLTKNITDMANVRADSNHVQSILRNLISNAIKFTHEGGEVIIDHKTENGNTSVRISDNGVGIDPDHIKIIMKKRFFSTNGTNNEKGSGFGLMLCHEFVRLNKGSLNIESKIELGTTITFTLPQFKEIVQS